MADFQQNQKELIFKLCLFFGALQYIKCSISQIAHMKNLSVLERRIELTECIREFQARATYDCKKMREDNLIDRSRDLRACQQQQQQSS